MGVHGRRPTLLRVTALSKGDRPNGPDRAGQPAIATGEFRSSAHFRSWQLYGHPSGLTRLPSSRQPGSPTCAGSEMGNRRWALLSAMPPTGLLGHDGVGLHAVALQIASPGLLHLRVALVIGFMVELNALRRSAWRPPPSTPLDSTCLTRPSSTGLCSSFSRAQHRLANKCMPSPSLSSGTTTPNGINSLGRYGGAYGTTFV